MDDERFWQLIEQSQRDASDCDEQTEKLTALLQNLEPEEIVAFDNFFSRCRAAAYREELWAVAYIVNGGCSDDGFEYFRNWVIGRGRKYFEAAMQNPERAADQAVADDPEKETNECEALMYCAMDAYQARTGREMPPGATIEWKLTGEPWGDDDLEKLYPRLCKKFGLL